MLDAWLASEESVNNEEEHDWNSVNYWATRLRPLWVNEGVEGGFIEDGDITEPDVGEETVVVVCNRFGEENGKSPFMQYLLPMILTRVMILKQKYKKVLFVWVKCMP